MSKRQPKERPAPKPRPWTKRCDQVPCGWHLQMAESSLMENLKALLKEAIDGK